MKRIIQIILTALGLCSGCSKSPVLTPAQFTQEFFEAMQNSFPDIKINVVRDLELKIICPNGTEFSTFLSNAYNDYKLNPQSKNEIIKRFVASGKETINGLLKSFDPNRIVPIIKDKAWLEETRQSMLSRGAKEVKNQVYEDFISDLIILYAEDTSQNIRYLAPEDLESAKIDRKDLRKLACKNLNQLLPPIELHGKDGFYMITAGGTYEASILLLDSIWSSGQIKVQGDIVAAIPTRDLLLVTGSQDKKGITRLKETAKKAYNEGSYFLTMKLFIYRNGVFEEFKEDNE
jgi:uncharacterized protein YtpQ (UPF0354 family)